MKRSAPLCLGLPLTAFLILLAAMASAAWSGDNGLTKKQGGYIATDAFESTLPLVLIDSGFPGSGAGTAAATIRIIDGDSGKNRIALPPRQILRAEILPESIAVMKEGKRDLHFRLLSLSGQGSGGTFPALAPNTLWTLSGSGRDRTMLRAYLSRLLAEAAAALPAPQADFCEVLIKQKDAYAYQGVYLLSEYVDNGIFPPPDADSLCLTRFNPAEELAPPQRYSAVRNSAVNGECPQGGNLAQLEKNLRSDDPQVFFDALAALDLDSFVETYLLIAVLANHSPQSAPYYFYKTDTGKTGVSPLWNFEQALDNAEFPFEFETAVDEQYPWFDRLLQDSGFISRVRKRFFELNRDAWSVTGFEASVDALAKRLGPALERDWLRWGEEYDAHPLQNFWSKDDDERIRRTLSPVQDLLKLKYVFRSNDTTVKEHMEQLRWKKALFTESKKTRKNLLLTCGFLLFFFFIVAYARRKM